MPPAGGVGLHHIMTPMEQVLREWSNEIWRDDLRRYGRKGPIGITEMDHLFNATKQGSGGRWNNPQYRYLERYERDDMTNYYLQDAMYNSLGKEMKSLNASEAAQIAKYREDIKKGDPAETKYYDNLYKGDIKNEESSIAYYRKLLKTEKDAKLRKDYLADISRDDVRLDKYRKDLADESSYYKDKYLKDIASLEKKDSRKQDEYALEMSVLLDEMGFSPSLGVAEDQSRKLVPLGHYDQGGYLPLGLSMALNTTGRPERVGDPGGSGGGSDQPLHVHLNMDGREIAQAILPSMVGATAKYGIRNSGKVTGLMRPS